MPIGIKGFQKGHPTFISEETYKKIAEKRRGLILPESWKKNIANANKNNMTGIENGLKTRFKASGSRGYALLGKNVYRNLHRWVERQLGKPDQCRRCGVFGEGRHMHWANLSGE